MYIRVCKLTLYSNMLMWGACRQSLPRIFTAWLRCYLMCNVLYFVMGGMWAYYIYLCWGDKLFADGNMPAAADMWEQIKVTSFG